MGGLPEIHIRMAEEDENGGKDQQHREMDGTNSTEGVERWDKLPASH